VQTKLIEAMAAGRAAVVTPAVPRPASTTTIRRRS
jgi:hypothetical protein